MNQYISGGNHTHNYTLTQQELDFDSKIPVTFRCPPKLREYIEQRAKASATTTSAFIEASLIKLFKTEQAVKKAHADLEAIVIQNFL
jgi:hypothetical protein